MDPKGFEPSTSALRTQRSPGRSAKQCRNCIYNDEFYIHIHMSAGNSQGQVFGGHLNRAVVSATCEMVVTVIDGKIDRYYDEDVGLNLFKF